MIAIGIISDRFRVRKPFMVIGGILAAVMIVVYLLQAGHHPSYYTLAIILALISLGLGIAYTPWMASYTETVEAHNPALTATGLAIWGLIIRFVVAGSFFLVPVVINSVTPLVNYGGQVSDLRDPVQDRDGLRHQRTRTSWPRPRRSRRTSSPRRSRSRRTSRPPHRRSRLTCWRSRRRTPTQLANAQKFQAELAVIQAHPALFTQLAKYSDPAKIPPALVSQAIAAAGGGAKGLGVLTTIATNKDAINGVIAVAPDLQKIAPYATDLQTIAPYSAQLTTIAPYSAELTKMAPYSAQLTALSKVPPAVFTYLQAHAADVQAAAAKTAGQWKTWYWICVGGVIFFLLSIPLLRGRWRTRDAKRDEAEHEAKVQEEMAKLQATV